jgi:hypothetical protein
MMGLRMQRASLSQVVNSSANIFSTDAKRISSAAGQLRTLQPLLLSPRPAEDEAVKQANDKNKDGEDEPVLYSEEYYAAQKAKRQGLGLIKFIGELFKLQMLTERIMHECVKKLLGNVENPEEEEIESLCKLLTTVGQILDTNQSSRPYGCLLLAHEGADTECQRQLTYAIYVTSMHSRFLWIHFLTYIFYPRMSSSSVNANGFHVTRSQLRRRSHRSMKGYVYYYFDLTSLAC